MPKTSAAQIIQSMQLVPYEKARAALQKACQALLQARSVDEVKSIRDTAEAFRAYAKQAGDKVLLSSAIEIKLRAERRAGQLLIAMEKSGERAGKHDNQHSLKSGGTDGSTTTAKIKKTLADLGISPNQSRAWQELAKHSDKVFDKEIGTLKEKTGHLTLTALRNALDSVNGNKGSKSGRRRNPPSPSEEELDEQAACIRAFLADCSDELLESLLQGIFIDVIKIRSLETAKRVFDKVGNLLAAEVKKACDRRGTPMMIPPDPRPQDSYIKPS